MKKISTLGFSVLFSLASFAGIAPTRLTVLAEGNANIKVTVDGNRFDQQSANNSIVFDNLQPGFHAVKVYQFTERRAGLFGHRLTGDYRLVYSAAINIKPLFATTIELNRFGKVQITEQPIHRAFSNRRWDKEDRSRNGRGYNGNDDDRKNDRDYDGKGHDDDDFGRNNDYDNDSHTISSSDFFAAERVMERENFDDARLLYAKRLMDENYLRAEQVKELARFFSFDNSRLEFAKYAYSKTIDRQNFSVVCNAFSSNYGKDQLMIYIRNYR